ncbi:MAG: rhomboid family intramembrane serine protease [Pseudomonadota bacterium]
MLLFTSAAPAATAVFVLTLGLSLLGLYRNPAVIRNNLFRPYYLFRRHQYATAITSGFVHADVPHLAFYLITFYFFAPTLEAYLLGTPAFVGLYLLALLASHGCTYALHRREPGYASLGASGAISAVLFAFIVYLPTERLVIFPVPVPVPAFMFAVVYVGYSWWAGRQRLGNINHDAHLCGALTGLAFVAVYEPAAYRQLASLLGG